MPNFYMYLNVVYLFYFRPLLIIPLLTTFWPGPVWSPWTRNLDWTQLLFGTDPALSLQHLKENPMKRKLGGKGLSKLPLPVKEALPLVQLSIIYKSSCFGKYILYFLFFWQLHLKLIDNCTSGSAPSCCIVIYLPSYRPNLTQLYAFMN